MGVKADFETFFDRVDHELLERRLNAYFQDTKLVTFLMNAVRAHDHDGLGVPTGLAFVTRAGQSFLDRFDEQIAAAGGKLMRLRRRFYDPLCKNKPQRKSCFKRRDDKPSC